MIKTSKAVQRFKKAFFIDPTTGRKHEGSQRMATWSSAYAPYMRRLLDMGQDKEISPQLILEVAQSYPAQSRSRQQCATALGCIARANAVDLPPSWSEITCGYKAPGKRIQDVIADLDIEREISSIESDKWKTAAALMATYGLRNYELFFCDFSRMNKENGYILSINQNEASDHRIILPLREEWPEKFGLFNLSAKLASFRCSNYKNKTLQSMGRRSSEQFRRYGISFTPKQLRHSWIVRAIDSGLPDMLCSKMSGIDAISYVKQYEKFTQARDDRWISAYLQRTQSDGSLTCCEVF